MKQFKGMRKQLFNPFLNNGHCLQCSLWGLDPQHLKKRMATNSHSNFFYSFSILFLAKQVADMSRNGVHTLHLAGLNLTPMDKKRSAAFTMNVRRMSQSTWSPHRNHHNRSGSLGSAASSDNIDSFYDESSESLSLSNSLSSPQKRLTNRITYTPKAKTIDRKYSYDSKLTHSADVARSKGLNRRVSLIERQSEYAEKKRLAKSFTIDQS